MAQQVVVTSISMSEDERKALKQDAKIHRMNVSQFMRGLYHAYRDARHEVTGAPNPAITRRDECLELLREGKTIAEVMEATGMSLSYVQKVAREYDLTPPNKERLTIEKLCEVIHALQTSEETYPTIAKRLKLTQSQLGNLIPKAQAAGLMRKRRPGRPKNV